MMYAILYMQSISMSCPSTLLSMSMSKETPLCSNSLVCAKGGRVYKRLLFPIDRILLF